ncbi:MAG: hypothetical protein WA979_02950 [Pacificimonas sp.]
MMTQESSFGSLSGSLLARKGGAKPAMRRQAYRFDEGDETAADDDCGWNDMGSDMLTPEQKESLLPSDSADGDAVFSAGPVSEAVHEADENDYADDVPTVVEQQRELAAKVVDEDMSAEQDAYLARLARESEPDDALSAPEPAPRAKPPVQRAPAGSKAKSAFTLRLDKPRHLKLRLASAFAHMSSQKLITEALDEYIEKHFPDLPV